MTKLKLRGIQDEKSVKITFELSATVHRDLIAYADMLGQETGQAISDPTKLIAPMLIAPAAIAASLAIPAYTGMHQRSFAPPNVPSPAVPPSPPATPGTTP